ncbi:MAG: GTP cyclohydrolase I FolE2 [Methanosarcinales archaeon]|nr:MAG: GTP cyclohydrolase I FolE2 [Methanosarcinales archaeon]
MRLPDAQARHPDVLIDLTRVGVTNVKKLVEVAREGKRAIILISTFDVFVDLPSDRKGANLSRNFEAIDEVLEEAIAAPVYEIEELCSEVARRLLNRHEYASKAEVRMRSEYIIKHQTPKTKTKCQEVVNIFAGAVATRAEESVRKTVGVEVVGMTACPCVQEIMREKAKNELLELNVPEAAINAFLNKIPMATHNQRGKGSVSIEVHEGQDVRIEKLIEVIKNSMSSQIYELLKRPDEIFVVESAHRNPKFAEDCVRLMAQMVVQTFQNLPDESIVTIKQTNEESIHQHDVFAERIATMGELRSEMLQ